MIMAVRGTLPCILKSPFLVSIIMYDHKDSWFLVPLKRKMNFKKVKVSENIWKNLRNRPNDNK